MLFLTPWTLGYVGERTISWNAWVSGAAIFAVAIVALVAFTEWEEWINLALGVWVAVSPWILGFYANATATNVHLAAGLAVALLAGVRLWFVSGSTANYRLIPIKRPGKTRPLLSAGTRQWMQHNPPTQVYLTDR